MRIFFRVLTWALLALTAAALYNLAQSIARQHPLWLIASQLCVLGGAIFIALASYAISRFGPPAPGRFLWTGIGLLVAGEVISTVLR